MTREEILLGVEQVAQEHLRVERALSADMDLVEDLELDSLLLLTLAVEVENRFRICLTEEAEAAIHTVGDLVDTVQRKLKQNAT